MPDQKLDSEAVARRRQSLAKDTYWTEANQEILLGPYNYLTNLPGKDMRGRLVLAFNMVLQVDSAALAIISEIIGMLHTASLLIDDVEDSADLRRGFPVAHSIFGTAQTINTSNYIYFMALARVRDLHSDRAVAIFTDELLNLHRGQGLDLYWRDTLTCPSEEEYIDMVMNKTGGLYRLAVRLMQEISNVEIDLIPLANVFGIIYQIQDDYLNLQSKNGFCEDITEGKFSFPIIHSIRAAPGNKELLNILKQKTKDVSLKTYAVEYMERATNTFAHTRAVLGEYGAVAEEIIGELEAEHNVDAEALRRILTVIRSIE
ncbi:uncharacterized protein SAPINGB_P004668 [Magnusiomyces paraingens]|uniref:Uncharacterized protein n=1 Tax=Magnusiomyces paraingens TaxID=2606893 RepID=A0A5E8C383_9ASCO|nr:uncharacterized protein SAPINGB_P004668 [Saprochaete ingens]VVT55615.1 unnamed protein product [Saprochaete ingens]